MATKMTTEGIFMKTIKQIADEIGVSKQAVYKRVKGSLHTVIAPYAHTVDGVVYISEQGENLIIEAFLKNTAYKEAYTEVYTPYAESHTKPHTEYTGAHTKNDEITFLREQNKVLLERLSDKDRQLDAERIHSREQMDKLSDLAGQLVELTRNNQVLLGAEQRRTNSALLMGSEGVTHQSEGQELKKGFFQRFFKK